MQFSNGSVCWTWWRDNSQKTKTNRFVLVGAGFILGGDGWWWINFGWWWVVVGIFWVVVGGGGFIFVDGGWWWVFFGWWSMKWRVVIGGDTVYNNPYEKSVSAFKFLKTLLYLLNKSSLWSMFCKKVFLVVNRAVKFTFSYIDQHLL